MASSTENEELRAENERLRDLVVKFQRGGVSDLHQMEVGRVLSTWRGYVRRGGDYFEWLARQRNHA